MSQPHCIKDLIRIFNHTFQAEYETELMCCETEPLYRPRSATQPYHQIVFAHGFYASALHEVAHWCIAGADRRKLLDYGYWYQPDGRNAEEQRVFEQVEVKPQALEWIFSLSAGFKFNFSADNLDGDITISTHFKERVHQQVEAYFNDHLPCRAKRFSQALLEFYRPDRPLHISEFNYYP